MRRLPEARSSEATIAVVGVLVRAVMLVIDSRTRLFSDSGGYVLAARSWMEPGQILPLLRERPNAFTVLWAPFLELPGAGVWLIAMHGAFVVAAAVVFYRGLLRLGVPRSSALTFAIAAELLPATFYYERVLIAEALAYAATVLWVYGFAWAVRPVRWSRIVVLSAGTAFLAGSLRTAFLVFLISCCAATVVVFAIEIIRRRRTLTDLRPAIRVAGAIASGTAIGVTLMSATQGLLSRADLAAQILNMRGLSDYNRIFKFGPLVRCDRADIHQYTVRAVCDVLGDEHASAGFDQYMWTGPIHEDWTGSSHSEFMDLGRAYADLARSAVRDDPAGAATIVARDAFRILLPMEHYRYTTDDWARNALQSSAPAIRVPENFGPDESDLIYRAVNVQDTVRFLAASALLILLVAVRHRQDEVWHGRLPGIAWFVNWLLLAFNAAPAVRFLVPLDAILLAAIAILLARTRVIPAAEQQITPAA